MISLEQEIASVVKVVKATQTNKFWGKIILDIRDGHLIEVVASQTMKPEKILTGEKVLCPSE